MESGNGLFLCIPTWRDDVLGLLWFYFDREHLERIIFNTQEELKAMKDSKGHAYYSNIVDVTYAIYVIK